MSHIHAQSAIEILTLLHLAAGADVEIEQLRSAAVITVKTSGGDTTILLPHEWACEGVHASRLQQAVADFHTKLAA